MSKFHIQERDPGDPYGDIVIKNRTGSTIIKLPLDDAPVPDWNTAQWNRASHLLEILNA